MRSRRAACAWSLLAAACTSSSPAEPPPAATPGLPDASSPVSGASSSDASSAGASSRSTASDAGSSSAGDASAAASADAAPDGNCAGLALCDTFDTYAAAGPPAASLWTLTDSMGCSGQGTVVYPITVDDTQSHSPPNSVKIVGGDSCGPLMINTSAFSKIAGSDVYGRFYILLSSTSATFDHVALAALGLTTDAGATVDVDMQGSYLQLASEGAGNATNVFMWQTDDSHVLPDKNSAGGAQSTYPTAGAWSCVEFHTSATSKALETWVNGQSVGGLTFVPGTTAVAASVNDQWNEGLSTLPSLAPTSLGFGWVVFSGPPMTIWIDDVAVSTTRIGCD